MNNNYIIYNKLGIIDNSNVGEVSQGNHNVDIFNIAFKDYDYSNSYLTILVTLPNGTQLPELSTSNKKFEFNGVQYKGFSFSLNETLTQLSGDMTMTFVLKSLDDDTQLCSSQYHLPIHGNDSNDIAPTITEQQYNQLLANVTENFGELSTQYEQSKQEVSDYVDNVLPTLKGEQGEAGTIEIGKVVTGSPDSQASVTNVGTASNAILNFVIPRGERGQKPDTSPYATNIGLEINNETFVITAKLYNENKQILSEQQVDLPLESVVVDGDYDEENKSIVLTLQNGKQVAAGIGDVISGLVSQSQLDSIVDNITLISNSDGGFSAGTNAHSSGGAAIGAGSSSEYGGAVGRSAWTSQGGAVGDNSKSGLGGAVGYDSLASAGFSGGSEAKSTVDAIQLGTGTNEDEHTLQIYGDNIYDAVTHTLKVANILLNGEDLFKLLESGGGIKTLEGQSANLYELSTGIYQIPAIDDGSTQGGYTLNLSSLSALPKQLKLDTSCSGILYVVEKENNRWFKLETAVAISSNRLYTYMGYSLGNGEGGADYQGFFVNMTGSSYNVNLVTGTDLANSLADIPIKKITTSPVVIYNLEDGIYQLPAACEVRYMGATSTTAFYLPTSTTGLLTVTSGRVTVGSNAKNAKFFEIKGATYQTNLLYTWKGYTVSDRGQFNKLSSALTTNNTEVSNLIASTSGMVDSGNIVRYLFGGSQYDTFVYQQNGVYMQGGKLYSNSKEVAVKEDVPKIVTLTQAEYDALGTYDEKTLYLIKEE